MSNALQIDGYEISTEHSRLQFDVIHGFLTASYWSAGIPMDTVKRAAENSLCFGIYKKETQVGYARIISDYATFAYLADVFVLESERGKGLSKWLVETIRNHPDLQRLRRWMLITRDAHTLYKKFGFEIAQNPENIMQIARPNIYSELN
ncbi:MAG: GNAT family N-acetyltransferase [Spirosomataceae bacterium]|jgi:GNAT superfamily N-acetyltransferase